MIERTEELGLAGRLPIVVGGQLVELRTLTLEESEIWQDGLTALVADFDLPDQNRPDAVLAAFVRQPASAMLKMLEAYDVDGRLPKDLKKRMSQAELYNAVKAAVLAELPFLTDARSAAEAFGPQLRAMATSVLFSLYQQASSTSGPLPSGDSTQPSSDDDSPRNGSSSSGSTANGASAEKPRKPRSRPSSQSDTVN